MRSDEAVITRDTETLRYRGTTAETNKRPFISRSPGAEVPPVL